MVDDTSRNTADLPYESGDLVHIRRSAPQEVPELYHHKHACEVVSTYKDYSRSGDESSDDEPLNKYTYRLSPVTKDTTLSTLYYHSHLVPSPRGYKHIDALLGEHSADDPPEWERDLGKLMREDLETINTCLSVVNDTDPTKDWMREIRKGNLDRTNSVFAEMLLLYHLRIELEHSSVQMNVRFDENGKDVDFRVITNDWDVWIEVYKPDYLNQIPEGGGWFSPEATGTSTGNKVREKFDGDRERFPDDAVVVLAVYLVENITQGFQLERWFDQDYFDVGDYCDALLTFTHLTFPTEFQHRPITPAGEDSMGFFDSVFGNDS